MLRTIVGLIAKQGAVLAAKNRISIIIKTVVREYLFFPTVSKYGRRFQTIKCVNNVPTICRVSFECYGVPNKRRGYVY